MPQGSNLILLALFILILIAILITLLNRYFYHKLKESFSLNSATKKALILFFGLMAFSPLVILNPLDITASIITIYSYLAYLWIIFILLFFGGGVLVDIYWLLLKLFTQSEKEYEKRIFILLVITITAILTVGIYEADNIQIETVVIETDKLPATVDKIRVVQISDVHFSQILGLSHAKQIIKIITSLHPDILLSTGDFLDKGIPNKAEIAHLFKEIKTPLGKYASTGNHEFFIGIENAERFITSTGFVLLRNRGITINKTINITAIDDHTGTRFGEFLPQEKDVFNQIQRDRFTIHMKHQPRIDKEALKLFDLQLSGHTHAGQIFPASLLVKLIFPYTQGTFKLEKGKYLHVSRGTGTWGPPIRFFAPPEITIIEIVKKHPKQNH